jgi:hypothetical protein
MSHVVLLGDSIFDNAAYVPGGPAVIEQVRSQLPSGWRATLLARDGAMAEDVARQLARLPAGASHLVVSVGGNDALGCSGLVRNTRLSAEEAFDGLADAYEQFRRDYQAMLEGVLAAERPTAVCTIYDAIPTLSRIEVAALSVFNDVILREAFRAGLPVLDLRLICGQAGDYSTVSPIEPSRVGGARIAWGVVRVVTRHDFRRAESVIYGPERDG